MTGGLHNQELAPSPCMRRARKAACVHATSADSLGHQLQFHRQII